MEFITDDRGFTVVYTDGSCINNGSPGARAGFGVYFRDNHPFNVSEPLIGTPTNNRAEIHAALRAINIAHSQGIKKLSIRSDSEYVIKAMTEWMPAWIANNWIKPNGGPVLNRGDLISLHDAAENLEVEWQHVPAHVGIVGNERAHNLAVAGAEITSDN